ncbi:hypothetical protein I3760_16G026600 [Carya illinoinensis]|uniref:AAA+ ATPase domain-containing protein n=1 Tax=Carya illinoinensis TaxID=32201 RepID=A0A922D0U4_CARIL|nr:hypothetical protein I3760_16G026600 [Carya illinoinensis]KAG6671847.1 hypothetical protein I3842_16G025100 [Carya illinoinensis]
MIHLNFLQFRSKANGTLEFLHVSYWLPANDVKRNECSFNSSRMPDLVLIPTFILGFKTVDRLTSENRLPHLLLYGPPGTGKTSTFLAVARKLYGVQYHNMILELNASDDRGIDVVRQQIQDFASTQSFSFGAKSSVKLILLDEADAMTKDAQFALRRVIEKYTRNTRFTLICNHVNKIIPALQSRCTRFRFAPLDSFHVTERLKHVIEAEKLDVPESGLAALVRLSNGDMRKALNILQSTHMASQQITEEAVYLCTGNPLPKDIEQISYWLLNESFSESFKRISEMKTRKGLALVDIVREVTMFVFKIKMPSDVRVQLINDLADIEYICNLLFLHAIFCSSICKYMNLAIFSL